LGLADDMGRNGLADPAPLLGVEYGRQAPFCDTKRLDRNRYQHF
jgi:hypothetical protein